MTLYSGFSRNNGVILFLLFFWLILTGSHPVRQMELKTNAAKSLTDFLSEADKLPINTHARQFVNHYIAENKDCLFQIRQNSFATFNIIDDIFSKYGLPLQLKYLAVVESELNSKAVSRVGATGPWQLMPGTAQILGLHVSSSKDDRTNYYKSTKAAAIYLRDLYNEFGDWLLVLAAYNAGPAPVYRAIRRSGSRNFWVLQNYLPAETRSHVKKFIATHYYFEQQGGITTFTNAEWQACYKPLRVVARS